MDESMHLDSDRVPLSSIEAEMNLQMSNLMKKADEIIPKKKAVLVGLKLPSAQMMNMNSSSVDVRAQILRMKKYLMEQLGFPEDKIILIIDDDEEEDTKPTGQYIRDHLYRLVECSYPGDILFIHLIAYGCSDGLILAPDHTHIGDTYLRGLIYRAGKRGLNLTFLSDCLVPPKPLCPCPKDPLPIPSYAQTREKILKLMSDPNRMSRATLATGYYGFIRPTDLSHVDILLQGDDYKTKTETTTTRLPSRVILFTPFPSDEKVTPHNNHDVSEVVFPPPTGYKHTSYGAFTNSILDVIEETRGGPITNLELAQKAMVKLGGGQTPRLSCSHLNHAHNPFVC